MIVQIEKIVNEGVGLARDDDNKVIFIPYVLTGEEVDINITKSKKDYSLGKVRKILKPSPHRIEPQCPIFGKCGGCNFLHTTYENELNIKKEVLKDLFKRNGIEDNFKINIIKSPSRFHYRNNNQIKVDYDGHIGFFQQKSTKIIPFPEKKCLLLTKEIQNFINTLDEDILLFTKGFRIRSDEEVYKKLLATFKNDKYCYYNVNGIKYRVDIDGFFQVNNFTNSIFQDTVLSMIKSKKDYILEMYSGVGYFSIPIAKKGLAKKLDAVELSKEASKNAIYNNDLNNVKINSINSDSDKYFMESDKTPDLMIVDPPRSGMTKDIVNKIIDKKVPELIYISCGPSTYCRDIKPMLENGYEIEKFYILDNFPSTYHFEIISKLKYTKR